MSIDTNLQASSPTKARWMIVDDDADILYLLSHLAAQMTDAEIGCFSSPQEAVAAFAEAPDKFQFVITDLEMPGMDGIQLCRRLRAISPGVKILLSTGSQLLTTAEALQNGFCGLLPKPSFMATMKRVLVAAGMDSARRGNFSGVLTPA
jgi:CheY-like chemotaxis protein